MTPANHINELQKLKSQVSFLRVSSLSLSLVLLIGVLLLGFVISRDTTKIVPVEVRRPYEMGANYANKDYLLDMTGYVLDRILTVTPETVDYNNRTILKITDPDGYAELKTALDSAAARLKQEKITTIWVPRTEEIQERAMKVKVKGRLKTFIADKLTSERDKEYSVEFQITISGRLYVTKIQEVIAVEPVKPAAS